MRNLSKQTKNAKIIAQEKKSNPINWEITLQKQWIDRVQSSTTQNW